MTEIVRQQQFERLLWFGAALFAVFVFALLMVSNEFLLVLAVGGVLWLALLPYHSRLASSIALVTFASAFMVPGFPGRPFVWEFASLLGWSGAVITFALRRYSPDFPKIFRQNRWLFIWGFFYVCALVFTMRMRGTGLRIFGGERMGGRVYFQQVSVAVFPVLFMMVPFSPNQLVKLYLWQCVLSLSFIVSDLALASGSSMYWLLNFLELSNDSLSFEVASMTQGFRRFQSLASVSLAFFQLLLVLVPIRDFINRRAWITLPPVVLLLGLGFLGGHRALLVMISLTFLGVGWAQRVFTPPRVMILSLLLTFALTTAYLVGDRLPLAAQRALTILPGIHLDPFAEQDAAATLHGRTLMRNAGMRLIPHFLWIGRGFGQTDTVQAQWMTDDPNVNSQIESGTFYNGPVGLMVNTGLAGGVSMMAFIACGAFLAIRILKRVRQIGCESPFRRLCCVVAALYLTHTFVFTFLHGDSQFAMLLFALQTGLLVACSRHLFAPVPTPDAQPE